MPEKYYHTLNTDSQNNLHDKFNIFSRNKIVSNSNPPFMTFFEDPAPASFVYTIEDYPSNIGNSL